MTADPLPTLDDLIADRGLSLAEIAELAGISTRTFWLIRTGRLKSVRTATNAGLAKALRVKPSVLRKVLGVGTRKR